MVVLAAAGWLAYAQWWGQGGKHELAWRDLNGQLGRVEFTRKVTAVYRSRASLARLLDATMPGRAPQPPRVDWARDEVVVIALGPRSSTGYSLRIVRVVERRGGIDVYAREQTPSLGDPVTARVTYPYRALAIRRSDKRVSVKLQGRP
ncbi:MAG TPA: protease complex subunit PrcB family protein [Gaiellaceae bacterium]|nr:protease complex subunit PrcB family protein [Gaiellaceae bacterium]